VREKEKGKHHKRRNEPKSFKVVKIGPRKKGGKGKMSQTVIVPAAPGGTGTYQAVPEPAGAVVPSGIIPAWTSSDITLATITADPTGLIGTASYIAPGTVTFTVSATLADGTVVTGSIQEVIATPPPPPPPTITGFAVTRTA
jgi:hypothetical protein